VELRVATLRRLDVGRRRGTTTSALSSCSSAWNGSTALRSPATGLGGRWRRSPRLPTRQADTPAFFAVVGDVIFSVGRHQKNADRVQADAHSRHAV